MPETFFVIGNGWSGELREYSLPRFENPFILEWEAEGEGDIQLFRTAEAAEQFLDELDATYRGEPTDDDYTFINGIGWVLDGQ